MYAIVKTGGKQYRVEQGQSLLVERLPEDDGASVELEPLLYVDGSDVVDGADIGRVSVQARIVSHERGPKLRVVKFKPKRGYKRRTGHRQDLTRIEVTGIKLASGGRRRKAASGARAPESGRAPGSGSTPKSGRAPGSGSTPGSGRAPKSGRAPGSGSTPKSGRAPEQTSEKTAEASNGA